MSNINFNLNNGNDEINSLKEAIFKRARDKAESLNSELKANYTSDVKNDIMESARFSVRNNPFINLLDEEEVVDNSEKVQERPVIYHSREYAGKVVKRQAKTFPSRINNELYTTAVREGAMREASKTLRQNQNVMMSLKFLNTQAAIALNKSFFNDSEDSSVKEITFGV